MVLMQAEPFKLAVGEEVLADLRERLETVRLPAEMLYHRRNKTPRLEQARLTRKKGKTTIADDSYFGISLSYLKEMIETWRGPFLQSWGQREEELNRLQQFRMEVEDGVVVHYIYERATRPSKLGRAIPIILCHGWPSTCFDFENVIPLLTSQGFDVVAPSLCNFGFSESKNKLLGPSENARIFHILMTQGLGYKHYIAHGGDWGYYVASFMAAKFRECVGIHVTMAGGTVKGELSAVDINKVLRLGANAMLPSVTLSPYESQVMQRMKRTLFQHSAYFAQQVLKPDSLGFGLQDSPAGLLSYILEKFIFHTWEPENNVNGMLTTAMVYWVSGTATDTLRFYREAVFSGDLTALPSYLNVPAGILNAPGDILQMPSSVTQLSHDVRQYTYLKRGGHFIAMEQPEQVANDISKFVFHAIDFDKETVRCITRDASAGPPIKKQLAYSAPLLPFAFGGVALASKLVRSRL